ncbi:hypothetical protein GGR42_002804 [Saonia flava]|uniref:Uncharacterized protein n=1 Tax=Saonia flava TaxID=523696 RepID=A0A846R1K8_9FLAO|nr:hypothetical protein [Saonia flava]
MPIFLAECQFVASGIDISNKRLAGENKEIVLITQHLDKKIAPNKTYKQCGFRALP